MSIKLIIVEDLEEVRNGLKNFIELSSDFKVLDTYATAEEALDGIPELKPDIVIMDINLPGMNGIECIRQVKNKNLSTQFMMFTVYENDEKVFEALKAGASGYLLKNTGLVQLIEALKELHNGGSPMSSNIARKLVTIFREQNKTRVVETLSQRENEILQLLSKGLLYKEIADQLHISTATVRQHIHRIYEKLHVQNRTEAINKAFRKN
ncbi:MAG: response regulator transcription factor [Bacteroidetes bacterium]|nr:response regulator transcription factor [Bacteroidota bacterium]MBS1632148.1 response regulator transcription factor [Bacteroidota bacterium]